MEQKKNWNILSPVQFDAVSEQVETPASGGSAFRPCGYNLEVTREGVVRHIGSERIRKAQVSCHAKIVHKQGHVRIGASFEGKMYYPSLAQLVARAWLPDWYEGCGIIWKDDDSLNNHADNLRVCTPSEARSAKAIKALRLKCEKECKDYGIFRPCGIHDIECTQDGIFRRNGVIYRPSKTTANHRKVMKLCITIDRRRLYLNSAELVARAWMIDYDPDKYIIRKDGDLYNIHIDNLAQVTRKEFNSWANSTTNLNRIPTIDEEIRRLKQIQEECQMNINFLQTGSFEEYNRYVETFLYRELMNYAIVSCDQSKSNAADVVHDAIIDLYELIDTNRMVWSPLMFCRSRVKLYGRGKQVKRGHRLPTKINNEIVKLNLDSLCQKFKVHPQRHKNLV